MHAVVVPRPRASNGRVVFTKECVSVLPFAIFLSLSAVSSSVRCVCLPACLYRQRLLLKKNASTEAEKAMIAKIKKECGTTFTSKLEGMLQDIERSKEFMDEYHRVSRGEDVDGLAASNGEMELLGINGIRASHSRRSSKLEGMLQNIERSKQFMEGEPEHKPRPAQRMWIG